MSIYTEIAKKFQLVTRQMEQSAIKVGRDPETVKLVVVTKGQDLDRIKVVMDLGARELGENRFEEALPKIVDLSAYRDVHWHMIGHVQSRRAKLAFDGFDLIHSLDSKKLAVIYDSLAEGKGRTLPVLLEMNAGGETTKYGWDISRSTVLGEAIQTVDDIMRLPNLAIKGLMTMAPLTSDIDTLRQIYRRMKRVQVDLQAKYPTRDIIELSMGTSVDYLIAIEEGATLIRIGQAILGKRS